MPEKFNNTKADTKAADLRSALNHLASEHFALSALQMQEQYDGRTAASDALVTAEAGNTADFKAAIASIYGNEGASAFEKIWVTNHVNAQSDYVKAVKITMRLRVQLCKTDRRLHNGVCYIPGFRNSRQPAKIGSTTSTDNT